MVNLIHFAPHELLHYLRGVHQGCQQCSVAIISLLRGDSIRCFYNDHVAYVHEEEERIVHVGCFPRISQDVNIGLRELALYVRPDDYYLGYDGRAGQFFCCVPTYKIFANHEDPALAVSKAILRAVMAKEKTTNGQSVVLEEISGVLPNDVE